MKPIVSLIASGLNLLTFQGVTLSQGVIIVATVEGDLLRIQPDGSIALWVNLSRYGVPAGIVDRQGTIGAVLSAQEVGHALMQVAPGGKIALVADLSNWAGEFGAPFGIAVHQGYYPYYCVTIATDVVRSSGIVVRVTLSGGVSILAKLSSSPFGIAAVAVEQSSAQSVGQSPVISTMPQAANHCLYVTQQDGQLLQIAAGKIAPIADLVAAQLGIPLGVAAGSDGCVVTTNAGWLVQVFPDRLLPLVNLLELGFGIPGTIARCNGGWIVTTSAGNVLRVAV